MLKTRVVGVLIVKNRIVVQSINFKKYLPVGVPSIAVDYLNKWGIDEIVVLDIDATAQNRKPLFDEIADYSKYCHVPLAVGGGIKTIDDIKGVISSGADKVVINTAVIVNPELITEGARLFGNQCIVASIDAKKKSDGKYEAFINDGRTSTGRSPSEVAIAAGKYGAGEIFLNSIDRDGSKQGYDLELIKQVVEVVNVPVVVCGGVSHSKHFQQALDFDVSGVAAANFFHYFEHSALSTKSWMKTSGDNIRLDSYASYEGYNFDFLGRPAKKEDIVLEKLRFEYIPEEII